MNDRVGSFDATPRMKYRERIEMTSGIFNGVASALGPATEVARGEPVKPPGSTASVAGTDDKAHAPLVKMGTEISGPRVPPSPGEISSAVDELNAAVQNSQRAIQFSVDDESGDVIIKVVDAETDEIIRQIPPEEVVRLARQMEESAGGLLRTEV